MILHKTCLKSARWYWPTPFIRVFFSNSKFLRICTALVAAPFRRYRATIHMFSVLAWDSNLFRKSTTKTPLSYGAGDWHWVDKVAGSSWTMIPGAFEKVVRESLQIKILGWNSTFTRFRVVRPIVWGTRTVVAVTLIVSSEKILFCLINHFHFSSLVITFGLEHIEYEEENIQNRSMRIKPSQAYSCLAQPSSDLPLPCHLWQTDKLILRFADSIALAQGSRSTRPSGS